MSDRSDDIWRCAVALLALPGQKPQLGMRTAHSVNRQDDLGRLVVKIGDRLADHRVHNALLQAGVGLGRSPEGPEVLRAGGEGQRLEIERLAGRRVIIGDPRLDLAETL